MFKGITSIVLIVFFCFNLVPVVQCQTQEQEGEGEEIIGYIKEFKKGQLIINNDVKEEKKVPLRVRDIIKTLKSKAIIELKDCSSELEMGEETKVKVLGIRRFEVFKTRKRSALRVMEKEDTCPPIEIVAEFIKLHSEGTDFLVSVQGSEVKWAVVEGKVNVKARDETEFPFTPQLYTGKTMATVSKDRPLELEYLPKTSRAWKWGMLGGSAVALGGLAYLAHRLISKDDKISESSDEINVLIMKDTNTGPVIKNEVDDLGRYVEEITNNTTIIRDSLKKMEYLSTGQVKDEASTGEAPGGTAGIPCEDIRTAIDRIDKVAEEIGEGVKKIDDAAGKIDDAAGKIDDAAERIDEESGTIRTIGKNSGFLATAAGIGVVASIVLILLHDVYAGVDDSDAFLLVEPELNSQHAGIKLGVKQRF